mmetsp:Transcript_2995/g.6280  ORF Transcript_2995/g.6280 Transcript_2995/m.6280 type:complete len:203 (-) Transcript_2995:1374-1982(-)
MGMAGLWRKGENEDDPTSPVLPSKLVAYMHAWIAAESRHRARAPHWSRAAIDGRARPGSGAILVPRLDRGRATAHERGGEHHRQVDVGKQGDGVVHRLTPDQVAVGERVLRGVGVAHVDDEIDLALGEEVVDVGIRLAHRLVQHLHRDALFEVEVVGALGAEDLEAQLGERGGRLHEVDLGRVGAEAEEDGFLGHLEASREH